MQSHSSQQSLKLLSSISELKVRYIQQHKSENKFHQRVLKRISPNTSQRLVKKEVKSQVQKNNYMIQNRSPINSNFCMKRQKFREQSRYFSLKDIKTASSSKTEFFSIQLQKSPNPQKVSIKNTIDSNLFFVRTQTKPVNKESFMAKAESKLNDILKQRSIRNIKLTHLLQTQNDPIDQQQISIPQLNQQNQFLYQQQINCPQKKIRTSQSKDTIIYKNVGKQHQESNENSLNFISPQKQKEENSIKMIDIEQNQLVKGNLEHNKFTERRSLKNLISTNISFKEKACIQEENQVTLQKIVVQDVIVEQSFTETYRTGCSIVWDNQEFQQRQISDKISNLNPIEQFIHLYKFRYEQYPDQRQQLNEDQMRDILGKLAQTTRRYRMKYANLKNADLKQVRNIDYTVPQKIII